MKSKHSDNALPSWSRIPHQSGLGEPASTPTGRSIRGARVSIWTNHPQPNGRPPNERARYCRGCVGGLLGCRSDHVLWSVFCCSECDGWQYCALQSLVRLCPFASVDPGQLVLPFTLAMAAVGLVMTALTHAELRRPAGTEAKRANVSTGLSLIIWMLVTSIIALALIGIVGWIADFFQ
jgi:hypothetical protein